MDLELSGIADITEVAEPSETVGIRVASVELGIEFDDDLLYDQVNQYTDDYNLDDDYLSASGSSNEGINEDQSQQRDEEGEEEGNNNESSLGSIRICSYVHTCNVCDNSGKQVPPCFCYLILYDPATNPDYLTYVHSPRKIESERRKKSTKSSNK